MAKARKLEDLAVDEVSLVDEPANKIRFLLTKRKGETMSTETITKTEDEKTEPTVSKNTTVLEAIQRILTLEGMTEEAKGELEKLIVTLKQEEEEVEAPESAETVEEAPEAEAAVEEEEKGKTEAKQEDEIEEEDKEEDEEEKKMKALVEKFSEIFVTKEDFAKFATQTAQAIRTLSQ